MEDSPEQREVGGRPPTFRFRPRLNRRGQNARGSTASLLAVLPWSVALAATGRQGQNDPLSVTKNKGEHSSPGEESQRTCRRLRRCLLEQGSDSVTPREISLVLLVQGEDKESPECAHHGNLQLLAGAEFVESQ
ncbi:hypothetical protein NDU88_007089 [Pleurodeles waltl]|uniref:Uncharacterized protein n=1 Tax=Pleurodeles waltl TaxID=8319 RepID=A0AAV7QJP2_PLEWA|nr:hypothetical protein NDU88_007089 [Pleurodeles waltl]